MTVPEPAIAVELRALRKEYGATVAVDDVTLSVRVGTIHSLVGENGAGKSTLLGMLAGRVVPTSGRMHVDGRSLPTLTPRVARAAGIVAIYQELTIVPAMSALDNVFLARPRSHGVVLDRAAMRRRFAELAERVGAGMTPDVRAGDLSLADRQLLEVMRALEADARVIVFDEPTAPLALEARERVLTLMRSLRDAGLAVLFVSHHLEEVLEVSDEITVLRDGRSVAHGPGDAWTKESLIRSMLGDRVADAIADSVADNAETAGTRAAGRAEGARPPRTPEVALEVRGLDVGTKIHDVSLTVRRGEVLGIAGLVGAGRSTVLRALAGLEREATGEIVVDGRPHRLPRTVRGALSLGLVLLPEDRKGQGLVPQLSAASNIVLGTAARATRSGVLTRRRVHRTAEPLAAAFGLRETYLVRAAAHLSGGNQQKLLLARAARRAPAVLLADEPTRGIDVGGKKQIRDTLREMADNGLSVVMVSGEHEELLEVADRIVVLSAGRITAHIDNTARDVSEQDILDAAFSKETHHVA